MTQEKLSWPIEVRNSLLVVLVAVALYLNTFDVPWYFDDFRNIVENNHIKDLSTALSQIFSLRGVSNLSFAVDYQLWGLDVFGYHLTNTIIHALSSLLTYGLLRQLLGERVGLALFGALLFAVHPVQTQAVTYVVQRMASLGALFALAALFFYLRANSALETEKRLCAPRHLGWYLLAFVCSVLACFAKENTITFPLVMLFAGWAHPGAEQKPLRARLLHLAPMLLLPLLLVGAQLFVEGSVLERIMEGTAGAVFDAEVSGRRAAGDGGISRLELPLRYFSTELVVFWRYLVLVLLPYAQTLDYGTSLVKEIVNLKSFLALLGIVLVGMTALRARKTNRLVTLGIGWVLLTLAVESTFIPLDPIYEHRLYLPLFGYILLFLEAFRRIEGARVRVVGALAILLLLGGLTLQRNALWRDPLAFWQDNIAKVPQASRPYFNLAKMYWQIGKRDLALAAYGDALERNPFDPYLIRVEMSQIYMARGEKQTAMRLLEESIGVAPERTEAYISLGGVLIESGQVDAGMRMLRRTVELNPTDPRALFNLAVACNWTGNQAEAEIYFRRSLANDRDSQKARFGLGMLLYQSSRRAEALVELNAAAVLLPVNPKILYYQGVVAFELGKLEQTRNIRQRLSSIHSDYADKLSTLIAGRQ